MKQEIGSGEVGKPSVYNFDASSVMIYPKSLATETDMNYKFPLSSCGYKDPGGTNNWYPFYVNYTQKKINNSSQ